MAKFDFRQMSWRTNGPPVQRRSRQGIFWLVWPESTKILGGRVACSNGIKAAPVNNGSTVCIKICSELISSTVLNLSWRSLSWEINCTKRGNAFSASIVADILEPTDYINTIPMQRVQNAITQVDRWRTKKQKETTQVMSYQYKVVDLGSLN